VIPELGAFALGIVLGGVAGWFVQRIESGATKRAERLLELERTITENQTNTVRGFAQAIQQIYDREHGKGGPT
jgi:hypothetical protein